MSSSSALSVRRIYIILRFEQVVLSMLHFWGSSFLASLRHIALPFRTSKSSTRYLMLRIGADTHLFIGLTDQSSMSGAFHSDIANNILNLIAVRLLVKPKAQTSTLLDNPCSKQCSFLSDASRKDQSIHFTFEFHIIAADEMEDSINEYFEGEFACRILRGRDLAKVCSPCKRLPTRLFVQDFFCLFFHVVLVVGFGVSIE